MLVGCPRGFLVDALPGTERIVYEPGELVLHEGGLRTALHLIEDGTAEVVVAGVPQATIGPGGICGELTLLDDRPQVATVSAVTRLTALVVAPQFASAMLDRMVLFRQRLMADIAQRLGAAADRADRPELVMLPTPSQAGPDSIVRRGASVLPAGVQWRQRPRRGRIFVVALILALVGVVVGSVYEPPMLVISAAPPIDVLDGIEIEGVDTYRPSGAYLLTAIQVERGNALQVLASLFRSDRRVIPRERAGQIEAERTGVLAHRLFEQSRSLAAAAAAEALGMDVEVSGSGAEVATVRSAASIRPLRVGDVLVAVDGKKISLASDLRVAFAEPHKKDAARVLRVERDGERLDVALRPDDGRLSLLAVTRDLHVRLPFRIRFSDEEITGHSAGLVYALAIADLLDERDRARGRTIAATGTVDLDGYVGPVSGVQYKTAAAWEAGTVLMLVPSRNLHEVDVRIRTLGVDSLDEALKLLRD